MTFETLQYIHRLLTLEAETTKRIYTRKRDYLIELKEANAPKEDREIARENLETADRIYAKALRALTEFEEHEWR